MQKSREFVANILKKEGKQATKTYDSLKSDNSGKFMRYENMFGINWEEFSDKELNSIARMKLKGSNLCVLALQAKDTRKTKPEVKKTNTRSARRVGPEPV